jgi:hypothetical protein
MDGLRLQDVEAHRASFRTFGSHSMPDRGIEEGLPGVAEQVHSGIGQAHVNDADRLDARPQRLSVDQWGGSTEPSKVAAIHGIAECLT